MNQPETAPEFDDETEIIEPSALGKLFTQLGGALGLNDEEEIDLDDDAFEDDEDDSDAEADLEFDEEAF